MVNLFAIWNEIYDPTDRKQEQHCCDAWFVYLTHNKKSNYIQITQNKNAIASISYFHNNRKKNLEQKKVCNSAVDIEERGSGRKLDPREFLPI